MALDPGGNGLGRGLLGGDGAGPGQTTSVVRLDFLPPSGRRLVVVRVRRTRVDLGGLGELNPGRHCHGLDGAAHPPPMRGVHPGDGGDLGPGAGP